MMKYPWSIEREYYAQLRKVINALKIVTNMRYDSESEDKVAELMALYDTTQATQRAIEQSKTISRMLKEYTKEQLDDLIDDTLKTSASWSMRVNIFENDPKLRLLLEEWVSENTRLIKSIPSDYFNTLQRLVSTALVDGITTKTLAKQIENLYGVTENRAKLIAVDQIGKLNGQITKARQEYLGIRFYRWRTARDQRVREEHAEREGKLYAWSMQDAGKSYNGQVARMTPSDGYPGIPIRCRCIAEPVIEAIDPDISQEIL